jgi:hypothetical protein
LSIRLEINSCSDSWWKRKPWCLGHLQKIWICQTKTAQFLRLRISTPINISFRTNILHEKPRRSARQSNRNITWLYDYRWIDFQQTATQAFISNKIQLPSLSLSSICVSALDKTSFCHPQLLKSPSITKWERSFMNQPDESACLIFDFAEVAGRRIIFWYLYKLLLAATGQRLVPPTPA